MFIENTMTRKVITIGKDAPVGEAQALLAQHNIRHLPVVGSDDQLIGMITDRDIRSVMPYQLVADPTRALHDPESVRQREKVARMTVAEIMSTDLIKISPMDTIQDALLLIQRSKVGALPVVDDHNHLKGIVSVRDLLRAFINVLGIGEPGTLICVLVEEKVGQLKRIVDAVTEMNVSFGSVLVARYWDQNKRAVFLYLLTVNIGPVKKKLVELGFTLLDPMQWYMDQLPQ
ncbi:MAG: CBS and ACT domain-containing protein [Desulfobacterales bacterium]